MDDRARAIMDMARETLHRVRDVEVIPRAHRDDGMLTDHSINMPKKPPPPTVEEVRQMIRDALAEQPRAPTVAQIEDAFGQVVSHQRKHLHAETGKLDRKYDELLRVLSDLLKATDALEKSLGVDDRSAKVIDLPALPMRGFRHG